MRYTNFCCFNTRCEIHHFCRFSPSIRSLSNLRWACLYSNQSLIMNKYSDATEISNSCTRLCKICYYAYEQHWLFRLVLSLLLIQNILFWTKNHQRTKIVQKSHEIIRVFIVWNIYWKNLLQMYVIVYIAHID